MADVHIFAIDLAKRSFRVCATDPGGAVLFNRTVSRSKLEEMLGAQQPCIVAMEACATSHFWGRFAQSLGHDVRLIPPIYVKPFVKRQKNDAADAAAIAAAALRPNIHYVAVKSAEHQARAVSFRTHQCFVRQRTQLINALRGHLAEFGLVFPQGPAHLKAVTGTLAKAGDTVPASVTDIARLYLDQIELLTQKIDDLTRALHDTSRVSEEMRRLCGVPGVGPVTAGAIMAFAPDLQTFNSERNFAAWLGLAARPASAPLQDGPERHSQAAHRRGNEPDTLDRAQGRVPRHLAGACFRTQTSHGRGGRTGEQDSSDHLGHDDEGAELPDGVTRGLFWQVTENA